MQDCDSSSFSSHYSNCKLLKNHIILAKPNKLVAQLCNRGHLLKQRFFHFFFFSIVQSSLSGSFDQKQILTSFLQFSNFTLIAIFMREKKKRFYKIKKKKILAHGLKKVSQMVWPKTKKQKNKKKKDLCIS